MRSTLRNAVPPTIKTTRTIVHEDEHLFGSILPAISKLLWPNKTAANLAAAIGCSERAAEFYLAGGREWSGDAIAVLITEILKRRKMRNVKILGK